ncbi:MAG: hypothetical protein ABL918_07125 [Chakrabartia sp.]
MKRVLIALLLLAGCSDSANQGDSSESVLQNQAQAIETATEESVKQTIKQIEIDAEREAPPRAQ